jgi:hypothetical protein
MKTFHLSPLLQSLLFRCFNALGLVTHDDDPEPPEPDVPDAGDGGSGDGVDGDPDGSGGGDGESGTNPDGSAKQPVERSPEDLAKALRKMERRIHNRTKALGAKDQELTALRQQLADLQARGPQTAPAEGDDDDGGTPPASNPGKGNKPKLVTVEEAARLAREFAEDQTYRASIATQTKAMLKAGTALDPNFRATVLEVAEDLPIMDAQTQRPTPFMEAVLDCGALAAEVMAKIAADDELREELTEIQNNPRALARRLALVETEVKKKPRSRSSAATPLEPVRGGGSSSKSEDSMTDAEWMEHHRTSTQRKKA